jgi:hypothetical protein
LDRLENAFGGTASKWGLSPRSRCRSRCGNRLIPGGANAILNFAPVVLRVHGNIVSSVNFTIEFATLAMSCGNKQAPRVVLRCGGYQKNGA